MHDSATLIPIRSQYQQGCRLQSCIGQYMRYTPACTVYKWGWARCIKDTASLYAVQESIVSRSVIIIRMVRFHVACSVQELDEVTKKDIYYKPSRINFETVDSVACGSRTVDFFQMTVGPSKVLDANALDSVLTQVKLPEDMPRRLHFVVHEDVYDTFTLTGGEKWAKRTERGGVTPAGVHREGLKAIHAWLQACAGLGHVGRPTAGGRRTGCDDGWCYSYSIPVVELLPPPQPPLPAEQPPSSTGCTR